MKDIRAVVLESVALDLLDFLAQSEGILDEALLIGLWFHLVFDRRELRLQADNLGASGGELGLFLGGDFTPHVLAGDGRAEMEEEYLVGFGKRDHSATDLAAFVGSAQDAPRGGELVEAEA